MYKKNRNLSKRTDFDIRLQNGGRINAFSSANRVKDYVPIQIQKKHEWLAKVWSEIYRVNPHDDFIRSLSTEDMMKTKWYEKYGFKEPNF